MLYYFPLEAYKERYTEQLSRPKTGWLERNWLAHGIEYNRIFTSIDNTCTSIENGQVLDATQRGKTALSQVGIFLDMIKKGKVKSSDILYFDDFWHPGIEAIAYALSIRNLTPKMYAFCYAQSVDKYDFTTKMLPWIRHFEKGIGSILSGIFVTSTLLKQLLVQAKIAPEDRVHVTGLIFSSEEVLERMKEYGSYEKKNRVLFSSRWDTEKNPSFFLSLVRFFHKNFDIKFTVNTSAPKMRSNDPHLLDTLFTYQRKYSETLRVYENLSKQGYYSLLAESKVQFNCAKQDWVSFTALEAMTFGCYPVYPNFRSFPELFSGSTEFLYTPNKVHKAADLVLKALSMSDYERKKRIDHCKHIVERFDESWLRMWQVMNNEPYEPLFPY